MSKVLKISGWIWIIGVVVLTVIGMVSKIHSEGFGAIFGSANPVSPGNALVTFAGMLPGIGMLMLAEKLSSTKR